MKDQTKTNEQLTKELVELHRRLAEYEKFQKLGNRKQYGAMLDILPFPIDIVNEDGNILFVNEKMRSVYGDVPLGQKCWLVYSQSKSQCKDCVGQQCMEFGESKSVEIVSPGGKTFQVSHTRILYEGEKAILRVFQAVEESHTQEDENFSILLEIGQHITSTLEIDRLLHIAVKKIVEVTPADKVCLTLYDESGKSKIAAFHTKAEDRKNGNPQLILKGSEDGNQEKPAPIFPNNHEGQIVFAKEISLESSLRIPLVNRGKTLGLLEFFVREMRRFSAKEIEFYQMIATQLSAMIANAQLYEKIRQDEDSLRKSEERYKNLFEYSPISLWEEDLSQTKVYLDSLSYSGVKDVKAYFSAHPDKLIECVRTVKIVDVNKATLTMYKVSSKEEFKDGLEQFFSPESYGTFIEILKAISEGKTTFEGEAINQTRLREKKYIRIQWSVAPSYEHNFSRVMVSILDITQSKMIEEALKKSEEKFRTLAEQSPNMIFINKRGNVVYANQKCEEIMGYKRHEFYAPDFNFMKLIAPESASLVYSNFMKHINGQEIMPYEYKLLTKAQQELDVIITSKLIEYEGAQAILGIITDITKHKQSEREKETIQAQLLQSQKMEIIGSLSGGIAHDFNNMLTAIIGFSDFVLSQIPEEAAIYEDVQEIKKIGEQAAALTKRLLVFSRRQMMQTQVLNLRELVAKMDSLLKRIIGEDIKMDVILQPDITCIKADPIQIEQAIMNLVVNARDAMPDGGTLTIRIQNVTVRDEDKILLPKAKVGDFVMISVEDTGIGMPPDVLNHLFEPFFTTKGSEKGTGLGLAVVYGIIQQHEGWIHVDSHYNQGSTFQLYFPTYLGSVEKRTEQNMSLAMLQGNKQRILLVEDECSILRFCLKALRQNGYIVFEAKSSSEALDIFQKENGNFDLIFSDVVLPDKPALQLIEEFYRSKPEISILLTSGYTDQKSQFDLIQKKNIPFLHKPYTLFGLLSAVRDCLTKAKTKINNHGSETS